MQCLLALLLTPLELPQVILRLMFKIKPRLPLLLLTLNHGLIPLFLLPTLILTPLFLGPIILLLLRLLWPPLRPLNLPLNLLLQAP